MLGGNFRETSDSIDLFSVEILNTETGQVINGPPLPQYRSFAAAAVNDELFVFTQRTEGGDKRQPNSMWETTSSTFPTPAFIDRAIDSLVIGDCIVFPRSVVYKPFLPPPLFALVPCHARDVIFSCSRQSIHVSRSV